MKNNVVLSIDTTSNERIKVGLLIDNKMDMREESHEKKKAQIVLPMLDALLREHYLTLQSLTAIDVNSGPGSFTGIRVGLAIANTLGSVLHIPVNENPIGKLVEAIYT